MTFISDEKIIQFLNQTKEVYGDELNIEKKIISSKNITTKRPDIYISASKWDKVVGKIATRNYNADEPINE